MKLIQNQKIRSQKSSKSLVQDKGVQNVSLSKKKAVNISGQSKGKRHAWRFSFTPPKIFIFAPLEIFQFCLLRNFNLVAPLAPVAAGERRGLQGHKTAIGTHYGDGLNNFGIKISDGGQRGPSKGVLTKKQVIKISGDGQR